IYNSEGATTSLQDTDVVGNKAENSGGGIYNLGTVMMGDGDIKGNTAMGISMNVGGGGIVSQGSASEMTLNNVSVTANEAYDGAGMKLLNGTVVSIVGGDISGNEATNTTGGAIHLYHPNTKVTISGTEIKNNSAKSAGGGIYNWIGNLSL